MATSSCTRGLVASSHWMQEVVTLSSSRTSCRQLNFSRLSVPQVSIRSLSDAIRHGQCRRGRRTSPSVMAPLSWNPVSRHQHGMRACASMDNNNRPSEDTESVSPIATSSEINRRVARMRFIEEVGPGRPDEDIDLAKAALLLSAEDEAMAYIERERDLAAVRREGRNPPALPSPVRTLSEQPDASSLPLGGATLAKWLARLNLLAREVETLLMKQSPNGDRPRYPLKVLKAVNAVLYEAQGYRGMSRPGDPRNSHLHLVLQRGIGSPALLSIVYMEVCKRLDVRMAGTPLDEDYFMTWPMVDGMQMIFDAFHSGQSFFWSDVKDLYLRFLPRGAAWESDASNHQPAAETSSSRTSSSGTPLDDLINFPNLPNLDLQPFASAGAGQQSSAVIGAQLTPSMSAAGKAARAGQEGGSASSSRGVREGRTSAGQQEGGVVSARESFADAQESEGGSGRLLPILKSSGGEDEASRDSRSGVPVRPASNREILACVVKTLRGIHWTRATRSQPSLSLRAPLLPTPPDNDPLSANHSHLELAKTLRPQDTILALSASERLVILLPNDWEVRREHGVILYHTGHYEYASQELMAAMALAPAGMAAGLQSLIDRIGLLMQELRWQQEDQGLGSGPLPL